MQKLIIVFLVCFILQGCSLVKWAATPFKNSVSNVPQSKIEGKSIVKCIGNLSISKEGVITCTKGYYSNEQTSNIQERRITIIERIKEFINNLMGWGFWLFVILLFLCPSLIGLIVGRLFEGVYGIGAKAFKQVSVAIQKVKDTTPSLIDALEKSTDTDVRAWIDEFKKKNNIK
jgi:hypothetical protein